MQKKKPGSRCALSLLLFALALLSLCSGKSHLALALPLILRIKSCGRGKSFGSGLVDVALSRFSNPLNCVLWMWQMYRYFPRGPHPLFPAPQGVGSTMPLHRRQPWPPPARGPNRPAQGPPGPPIAYQIGSLSDYIPA